MDNYQMVAKGLNILLFDFSYYVCSGLQQEYGDDWWKRGVLDVLYDEQKRDLPLSGEMNKLVESLDIANVLRLFDIHWREIFRKKLSIDHRTWAKELMGDRNKEAHRGSEDLSDDDTWRALDTMSRLCEQIEPQSAEEIRAMLRTIRYGSAYGSTASTAAAPAPVEAAQRKIGILETMPVKDLPSWREVIEPHPDVAQGRYKKAEFAADLAQVARGEGAYEYRDPVEFFARTYVTEGMTGLLEQALRRLCGKDGDPVIQLKTAFGGGKTHSMLALYHMMRGNVSIDKIPVIKPVLERAGVASLPKANVAVLVGTALAAAASKSKRPSNMPGITINTLWGEMAFQLAESAGNPALYDYVKESDKRGVSPGSEALKNLFDDCGVCLILIDELVAYGKKLYGASGLPAGTFDNFITFIQELSEAARASSSSLVVASLPESEIEIGGEAGKIVLDTIEHTFGRMESIWKPVAANEGFEVVRRRLFLDCKKTDARDSVCAAFSRMYIENQSDFPVESKEAEYRERMVSCYPIHPEVFDRLYEDWATLERFQRTRGVLRLMAAVIHELWMGNDAGLMIMPGSIPLDVPTVRDELTRHLAENWNSIVDSEVDGKKSIPYQKDRSNPRYGSRLASRRVARTVMLGSAPTVRSQSVRGIESSRIRLGVLQPGENIANFNDALTTLQTSLAYMYTNPSGDRFWYDTRPTLRKTVEDRATQIASPDVEHEIETRLRRLRKEPPFEGLHICPGSSLDVTDEQNTRLVILRPDDGYRAANPDCSALTAANDILNNRGGTPRIYRNMLAFIAPDSDMMTALKQETRRFLAWRSVKEDSADLNLDMAQNKETEGSLKRSDETVDARMKEAYCWLLVPKIDRKTDMKTISWSAERISGGGDGIITRAAKKMIQGENVISKWAPMLLLMELDGLLWRDSDDIQIKKLWDYLTTYCYLPRLANEFVLEEAIRAGLASTEYFAFASAFDGKRYIDLKFNQHVDRVERSGLLVKVGAAQKQLTEEAEQRNAAEAVQRGASTDNCTVTVTSRVTALPGTDKQDTERVQPEPESERAGNRRFYMSAELDNTRIGRDVQRLVEEVISHLASVDGCELEVSLEVSAKSPDGMSKQIVRTVMENCRTLKVRDFGFDD